MNRVGRRLQQATPQQHRRNVMAGSTKAKYTAALLFYCDGVIVETEELHR